MEAARGNHRALQPHHARAHARLRERFCDDPRFLALIAGGSVAKGIGRADSDVDVMFVASEEEWARRAAAHDYFLMPEGICDYPGGYADGKVIPLSFLEEAAARGSEPARFAFQDAFVICSRLPGLDQLLARIPVYPDQERAEKIASFLSQVMLLTWLMGEAEKRDDPFLSAQAATDLVLFGGRLLLAHNRILFPSFKWFLRAVETAPEKPPEFLALARALLSSPSAATAQSFHDALVGFREWGVSFDQAVSRCIEDTEWGWRTGRPALRDW